MKLLQDNPLGMALAAISGVLILLALGMAIVWKLPVSVETVETATQETTGADTVLVAHQIADISDFQVINEKPVFNETRLPVVEEVVDGEGELDLAVAIKDAPDVRLTGVIITPSLRIASLTPSDGELENVMAHQGEHLTGEYVGWRVGSVSPRTVVLESRDGQQLELELQVHDVKIKEPPKPVADAKPAAGGSGQPVGEDGQPLSRAEQIRQRIAERREELRREQEEQAQQDGAGKAAKPNDYQSAIRAMMNNKSKDKSSDDQKDG